MSAIQTLTLEDVPIAKRFLPLLLMQNPVKPPLTDALLKLKVSEEKIKEAYKRIKSAIPWNEEQLQALDLPPNTRNYNALVQGVGGAGKTSVMVAIACLIIELGGTVMLTAPTHDAVEAICDTIDDFNRDN